MRHGEQASENFIKYYSAKSRYEELIGQLQPDQSGEYNPELMQKAREAYDDYQAQDADRRTEAGERIKEKYLTEDRPGHDKKPDEALGTWDMLDLPPAKLNRAGLIVDKKGKFRIKNPNMPELPGAYVDQEVLKAFLLGLRDAQNTGAQWEVIQDVCEYLDVTVPEKPTEVEIKKNGGFLEALREKIAGSGAVEAAAILAVITIMLTMPRESGGPPIAGAQTVEMAQDGVYRLTAEDTMGIGSVAKRLLLNAGVNKPTDDQLFEVIKVLASDNTVAVPELGIDQGKDDEKLPVGFEVDIKRGSERAAEIASNQ